MPEIVPDILLSIHRVHNRRILHREKTIEIRKNRPNGIDKARIFLYETKTDGGAGAVVGECFCYYFSEPQIPNYAILAGSCLSMEQLVCYGNGKPIFGWYLSEVRQYVQPRPLSDFGIQRAPQSWCYLKGAA